MGSIAEPNASPRARVQFAYPIPHLGPNVRITPQARYYAVAELCRRAGITREFFRTWKVSVTPQKTVFEISNGTQKFITFPHAAGKILKSLAAGQFSCVSVPLAESNAGRDGSSISDCVVPFAASEIVAGKPLFFLTDQNHLECALDLPLSILLTLSRWEETLDSPRDTHGRFQAKNSITCTGRFLNRPIVDECGLAFEQALELLFPSWKMTPRNLRIKVSHDADHVGIPFRWRTVLRHSVRSGAIHNSFRDVFSSISGVEPTELNSVRSIALATKERGLNSTVYWKAAPLGPRDSGYDPRHNKVRQVVSWLDKIGVESGIHPGYNTFHSPEKLRREVAILRDMLGDRPLGGRQHYLRWSPDSWIDWENCGLAYDSSVGFAEQIGFKAGTCIPYRPWLFPLNRPADLIEIPLLVMDRTLLAYMGLTKREAIQAVHQIVDHCRMVGGVFTILWHNDAFLNSFYRDVYLSLLGFLSGAENYNWRAESTPLFS
jgi:uncharacterized protein DUF7033